MLCYQNQTKMDEGYQMNFLKKLFDINKRDDINQEFENEIKQACQCELIEIM